MQLSNFSCRILLNKTPINNFFNICCLLLIFSTLQIHSMRVYHPMFLKPNISNSEQQNLPKIDGNFPLKKLRKLPHVFNNVLELPFRSDADVVAEEHDGFFRFVAKMESEGGGEGQVRAQTLEIHPGITKIVVRKGDDDLDEMELLLEQVKVDTWRYRLPASTMPRLATAVVEEGELIVTVPKLGGREEGEFVGGRDVLGCSHQGLVLVQ